MEENKKLVEKSESSNKKLHLSDVIKRSLIDEWKNIRKLE